MGARGSPLGECRGGTVNLMEHRSALLALALLAVSPLYLKSAGELVAERRLALRRTAQMSSGPHRWAQVDDALADRMLAGRAWAFPAWPDPSADGSRHPRAGTSSANVAVIGVRTGEGSLRHSEEEVLLDDVTKVHCCLNGQNPLPSDGELQIRRRGQAPEVIQFRCRLPMGRTSDPKRWHEPRLSLVARGADQPMPSGAPLIDRLDGAVRVATVACGASALLTLAVLARSLRERGRASRPEATSTTPYRIPPSRDHEVVAVRSDVGWRALRMGWRVSAGAALLSVTWVACARLEVESYRSPVVRSSPMLRSPSALLAPL